MKRFGTRWSTRPVLGVVLTLLAVLAGLQYHWLGRLSEGEHARLEDQLQTAAGRFSEAFRGTFSQAQTLFQVPATPDDLPAADLTRGYHQWQTLATTPALLSAVYWIASDTAGALTLFRLDAQRGRLDEIDWPEDLLRWKKDLTPQVQAAANVVVRFTPRLELDAQQPALLIPSAAPWSMQSNATSLQVGYVLLAFDGAALGQRHIPVLIARHFTDAEDYHLAVRKTDNPARMLYASEAAPPAAVFDRPDVAVVLRPDTLGHRVMVSMVMDLDGDSAQVRTLTQSSTPWAVTKTDSTVEVSGFDYSYSTTDTDIRVGQPAGGTPGQVARVQSLIRRGPPTQMAAPAEAWELVATHRAGSLQAAVRQGRWRNLALSFGLMLVLAGSAILLVFTARRAQRLGQQQMEFVAGVSHELRTPLAVIYAAGENLADGVVADPERARQYGQLIRDEGRRLSRMVEQTLALARIGTGHRASTLEPTAIAAVLEQALATHRSILEAAEIDLTAHIPPDLPQVLADAPALQSALENLIHNAVKYSGTARRILVRAAQVGGEVQVAVQDFGIGIAPEAQPHLFEPFYRAPAVVEAQMPGSGIGLSLVRHVMDAHNGRATVASSPGEGSTFTLHLPVPPQTEAHA